MIIGVLALQGAFLEHATMLDRVKTQRGLDFEIVTVRNAQELSRCSALLIPGGESTVILSQASNSPGLLPALREFVSDETRPVYGSCAGMILMADEDGVASGRKGTRQVGLGGVRGMRVWRNLYGNQLASFEAPLDIPVLSQPDRPFPGIFIRAPAIHSLIDPVGGGDRRGKAGGANTETESSDPPSSSSSPPPPTEPLCRLPLHLSASAPTDTVRFGPASEDALRIVMARQGKHLVTSFHPELSQDVRIHEYFLLEMCGLGKA